MNQKYTAKDKETVVSLFLNGTSVSRLTSDTSIPRSTIYRWIKESQTQAEESDDYSPMNYYQLQRKYKKLESIVEILQRVNCKPTDPLSVVWLNFLDEKQKLHQNNVQE